MTISFPAGGGETSLPEICPEHRFPPKASQGDFPQGLTDKEETRAWDRGAPRPSVETPRVTSRRSIGPGKEGSLGKLGDSWGHQAGARGGGTASDPEGFRAASATCVQPVSWNLVPEAHYLPPPVQHVCLSAKNCRRAPGHERSLQRRSKHQTRSDVAETWSYHEGCFSNYGQRAKDAGGKSRL